MNLETNAKILLENCNKYALQKKNEIVTPEHVLYACTFIKEFIELYRDCDGEVQQLRTFLNQYFGKNKNENTRIVRLYMSNNFEQMLKIAEKHASDLYDTCVFEFKDTGARDVLNYIQSAEQNHGKQLYDYMSTNAMYG